MNEAQKAAQEPSYLILPHLYDEERQWGGWWERVAVGLALYQVGLVRGSPARGMYGKRGYRWYAVVRDEKGHDILRERCDKSTSVRRMLVWAGLITCQHWGRTEHTWRCRTCGERFKSL